MRGLEKTIFKRLRYLDEIYLNIDSNSAIVTGPDTPLRFMGEELR